MALVGGGRVYPSPPLPPMFGAIGPELVKYFCWVDKNWSLCIGSSVILVFIYKRNILIWATCIMSCHIASLFKISQITKYQMIKPFWPTHLTKLGCLTKKKSIKLTWAFRHNVTQRDTTRVVYPLNCRIYLMPCLVNYLNRIVFFDKMNNIFFLHLTTLAYQMALGICTMERKIRLPGWHALLQHQEILIL